MSFERIPPLWFQPNSKQLAVKRRVGFTNGSVFYAMFLQVGLERGKTLAVCLKHDRIGSWAEIARRAFSCRMCDLCGKNAPWKVRADDDVVGGRIMPGRLTVNRCSCSTG